MRCGKKKLFFLILKCCRLSWSLSRNTISLLYKTTVIPTILYNCSVWASSIRRKRVITALKSAQRPFALTIGRLFKSTSTDAAFILANIFPLHLKIIETVLKRSISALAALLPLSSLQVAGETSAKFFASEAPAGIPLGLHRKRVLRSEMLSLWNSAWQDANAGAQTRLFFPSVESASILSSSNFPFFLCSFLLGHCGLNNFLKSKSLRHRSVPACQGKWKMLLTFCLSVSTMPHTESALLILRLS